MKGLTMVPLLARPQVQHTPMSLRCRIVFFTPIISQALSGNDLAVQAEIAAYRSGIIDDADVRSIVYNTTISCFIGLWFSLGHLITANWVSMSSLLNTILITAIFLIQQG